MHSGYVCLARRARIVGGAAAVMLGSAVAILPIAPAAAALSLPGPLQSTSRGPITYGYEGAQAPETGACHPIDVSATLGSDGRTRITVDRPPGYPVRVEDGEDVVEGDDAMPAAGPFDLFVRFSTSPKPVSFYLVHGDDELFCEVDHFPLTSASVTVKRNGIAIRAQLSGPATVIVGFAGLPGAAEDRDGNGLDDVPSELIQLDLAGTLSVPVGTPAADRQVAMHLRDRQAQRSMGQIEETENRTLRTLEIAPWARGTALSRFLVWFEMIIPRATLRALHMPDPGKALVLHNEEPKRMEAVIDEKPPEIATYEYPQEIRLFEENGSDSGLLMSDANHRIGGGIGCIATVGPSGITMRFLAEAGLDETVTKGSVVVENAHEPVTFDPDRFEGAKDIVTLHAERRDRGERMSVSLTVTGQDGTTFECYADPPGLDRSGHTSTVLWLSGLLGVALSAILVARRVTRSGRPG